MRLNHRKLLTCHLCRQFRSILAQKHPSASVTGVRSLSDNKKGNGGNSYEDDYIYDEEGNEKIRPGGGKPRDLGKVLKDSISRVLSSKQDIPRTTNVAIVGGGLVGSAAAFFTAHKQKKNEHSIVVIEKDPMYTRASSSLSAGGIRHQFSVPENVQMSMFTTDFLRNIKFFLGELDEAPPDVQFNHHGYLFLAPREKSAKLAELVKMQKYLGAEVELFSAGMLKERFPWLNLDGIEVGSLGLHGEGWFDPHSLLAALKRKNLSLGVQYVDAEVVGFTKKYDKKGVSDRYMLASIISKDADGAMYETTCGQVVNCAGPWAAEVAEMAGVGTEQGLLSIPLPVRPRKRFVYVFHCPNGPGISTPLTVDTTGTYFRREGLGGMYICGASPESEAEEPSIDNMDVDYDFFNEKIWPRLAHRIPAFENIKLKSAWAGFYDYNLWDQNLIIGPHPMIPNFYFANGMSGHGLQQSVCIGNAISEMLLKRKYKSVDLSRFSFERIIEGEKVCEDFIV
ncbi:FAD-dependent oxidoreductase domain-containing protein 1-like [Saccostrea cucullata]|uniref:FAD-dependent oxidoreductase domain-containing protein 1-like n=1 Tax=Saccostrea cuccullata TaxID=36930 RepID=UPI002ED2B13D